MEKYHLYDPIRFLEIKNHTWDHPIHNHDHYEWIIVLEGEGIHKINETATSYKKGSVFFLRPEDVHNFEFTTYTHLIYFQFSIDLSVFSNDSSLRSKMLAAIQLIKLENVGDISQLFKAKSNYIDFLHLMSSTNEVLKLTPDVIKHYFLIFISFLKSSNSLKQDITPEINSILIFIRSNIKTRDRVTIKSLSTQFNISNNYFGEYFKKAIGLGLKEYIDQLLSTYLKNELLYTQKSLSQISYEYHFTDESHFSNYFKKHYGITPTEFRKES